MIGLRTVEEAHRNPLVAMVWLAEMSDRPAVRWILKGSAVLLISGI